MQMVNVYHFRGFVMEQMIAEINPMKLSRNVKVSDETDIQVYLYVEKIIEYYNKKDDK